MQQTRFGWLWGLRRCWYTNVNNVESRLKKSLATLPHEIQANENRKKNLIKYLLIHIKREREMGSRRLMKKKKNTILSLILAAAPFSTWCHPSHLPSSFAVITSCTRRLHPRPWHNWVPASTRLYAHMHAGLSVATWTSEVYLLVHASKRRALIRMDRLHDVERTSWHTQVDH